MLENDSSRFTMIHISGIFFVSFPHLNCACLGMNLCTQHGNHSSLVRFAIWVYNELFKGKGISAMRKTIISIGKRMTRIYQELLRYII